MITTRQRFTCTSLSCFLGKVKRETCQVSLFSAPPTSLFNQSSNSSYHLTSSSSSHHEIHILSVLQNNFHFIWITCIPCTWDPSKIPVYTFHLPNLLPIFTVTTHSFQNQQKATASSFYFSQKHIKDKKKRRHKRETSHSTQGKVHKAGNCHFLLLPTKNDRHHQHHHDRPPQPPLPSQSSSSPSIFIKYRRPLSKGCSKTEPRQTNIIHVHITSVQTNTLPNDFFFCCEQLL